MAYAPAPSSKENHKHRYNIFFAPCFLYFLLYFFVSFTVFVNLSEVVGLFFSQFNQYKHLHIITVKYIDVKLLLSIIIYLNTPFPLVGIFKEKSSGAASNIQFAIT